MRYTSTRDKSISVSFEQAICSGYAPGGGLFVPEKLPQIDPKLLQQWSSLSFPDLTKAVLRLFVSSDEVNEIELDSVCASAFQGFEYPPTKIVPVVKVGSLYIAELFHGPTFCFKDLGMRPVVNFLSHFSSKRNRKTTLLVSTTGDTGPAAVQAVSDVSNPLLTILVHYPDGQISDLQRRQLTTVNSPCVHVVAFEGGGDDMDTPIKRIQAEGDKDRMICGINSYNIGRPLAQMVHYIWTYLRVAEDIGVTPGDRDFVLDIVLPTGAMGNVAGGYMAKKMGLPLGKLCCGVNINDITHRAIQTGKFHRSDSMKKTLSDAINIQVPYNFERLLYYLTAGNHDLVKEWMTTVDTTAKLDLDQAWLEKLQSEFRSERVTDEAMCETMHKVVANFGYYSDPHTAVGLVAAESLGFKIAYENDRPKTNPVALLATASPCKFQESVTVALGKGGWETYEKDHFPKSASLIMNKTEIPPTIYKFRQGISLSENQMEWQDQAWKLIKQLGTAPINHSESLMSKS